MTTLLSVPNVSEGRDGVALAAIGDAFTGAGARVLDVHADVDHHRSVFTLAGVPGALASALAAGTEEALRLIDLSAERGIHPHVGVVDVVPFVHRTAADRGAACAEALVAAEEIGRLGVPVLLYGSLAGGRTRAEIRRGGPAALAERLASGELTPDFGPPRMDPRSGATLVAARPPLIAFNLEVDAPLDAALAAARAVREGGAEGLPGVRALGLELETRRHRAGLRERRGPRGRPARDAARGRAPARARRGRRGGRAAAPRGVRRLARRRPGPQPPHARGGAQGMSDPLVFFVAGPVDDDLAAAVRKRVRATAGAGWFDDPDAARPAERTAGGYVRVERPRTSWGRRCCSSGRRASAPHGVVVEVQWREEVVGHIEGGTWRAASSSSPAVSAAARRSGRRRAWPGSSP